MDHVKSQSKENQPSIEEKLRGRRDILGQTRMVKTSKHARLKVGERFVRHLWFFMYFSEKMCDFEKLWLISMKIRPLIVRNCTCNSRVNHQ